MNLYEEMKAAFPEIVGNLERSEANGKLAHAFLVVASSPRLRRKFAQALCMIGCCPDRKHGVPDTECPVCRRIASGDSPDVNLLYPQGKAYMIKVGDPGGNPESNTMRYFEEQFYLTRVSHARRKAGVILDADRMNASSQNAFLKTLEEPPPETLLILTTGNPASLLPTTRSRCQTITLPEGAFDYDFPGREELYRVLGRLASQKSFDLIAGEEAADALIELAGGLRAAAESAVEGRYREKLASAKETDPAFYKRLSGEAEDAAVGEYINIRREFLSALHAYFVQLYALSLGASRDDLANGEMFAELPEDLAPEPGRMEHAVKAAEELLRNLLYNISDELALRNFVFELCKGR